MVDTQREFNLHMRINMNLDLRNNKYKRIHLLLRPVLVDIFSTQDFNIFAFYSFVFLSIYAKVHVWIWGPKLWKSFFFFFYHVGSKILKTTSGTKDDSVFLFNSLSKGNNLYGYDMKTIHYFNCRICMSTFSPCTEVHRLENGIGLHPQTYCIMT